MKSHMLHMCSVIHIALERNVSCYMHIDTVLAAAIVAYNSKQIVYCLLHIHIHKHAHCLKINFYYKTTNHSKHSFSQFYAVNE